MNEKPLQRLINLVEFDREVVALEDSLVTTKTDLVHHQEAIATLRNTVKEVKQRVVVATKQVDEAELELAEIDDSLKQKKQRFDKAANMTEFRALKTEIDLLMEQQQKIEDVVATSWTDLENAQREAELLEASSLKEIEEHEIQIQAQEEALKVLDERIVEKSLLRVELEKNLPEEWRERYAMMRKRVVDPVVAIVNGACGSCFYLLPNQELTRLRRGALLTCSSCYRLLFDPESSVNEDQKREEA